ncbi:hypothetical protein MIND_00182300 [Mycena indigotica]|uniref:N-acetyltransferase domain-containing protein n=1 Tax=Mycena indigotica TaxID=2126181 RepID=A0A8H6WGQ8_9AGAR|nr:uncharacterized protein MIND_00182300 [Mycena indigotica]KAF7311724.1 hypothetical protein MIND_00182300 [Mycena indigotica]
MVMQPQPSKPPSSLKGEVVVRQYRPQDHDQVFALLRVGFAVGPGSPGETAVRRALWTPAAFACYALILASTALSIFGQTQAVLALCLELLALGVLVHLRRGAAQAFEDFCTRAAEDDLRDIPAYYQQPVPGSRAGFWVAVIGEEVVGYFGMEHLPSRPTIGHLRRLIVSPYHRRKGIASNIIDAIVAHAQAQPTLSDNLKLGCPYAAPLTTLELETSALQPPAIALYERHGFRVVGSRQMPLARAGLNNVTVWKMQRPVYGGLHAKTA